MRTIAPRHSRPACRARPLAPRPLRCCGRTAGSQSLATRRTMLILCSLRSGLSSARRRACSSLDTIWVRSHSRKDIGCTRLAPRV
eukprot:2603901-Pyramimonas_sp.AAC.1